MNWQLAVIIIKRLKIYYKRVDNDNSKFTFIRVNT